MAVHPGLERFFAPLVLLTWRRPLPYGGLDRRGFGGAVDLEFTGDRGATWHCLLTDEGVRFRRGKAPSARATIRLAPETLFRMLRGELSAAVAGLTGRMRVHGDPHYGFVLPAMVARIDAATKVEGWRGRAAALWRRFVVMSDHPRSANETARKS
jgi:putative sterol carrier protein